MKKNGIARMVAGGAAGGFEDDERMSDEQAAGLSSAAESAVGGVLANLRDEAPAAKPAARMSDRKAADLAGRAERAVGGVVANLRGQPPRMSDSRAAELSAQADRAVGGVLANLRSAPAEPRRSIARAAVAKDNRFAPIAGSMGAGNLVREDGTMKGQGYFGQVQHSSGRGATELGIEEGPPASFPYTPRGYMNYPSMVPTLSREEVSTMMSGNEGWPESIYQKARSYAKERLAQGRSPFAQTGEQYPAPGYEDQFMSRYPSAVMSYPNRTVGYQYAAGAPVTPYMSPIASRPVPQGAIMSMVRRSR